MNQLIVAFSISLVVLTVATPVVAQCVAPDSYNVFRGFEVSGELSDFEESDDQRAIYWPGVVFNQTEAPIWLVFEGVAPETTQFVFETRARTPGLTWALEAFNWDMGWYEELGFGSQSVNQDVVVAFDINPLTHVDLKGNVRARLGWRKTGFTVAWPWQVEIDMIAFCGDN